MKILLVASVGAALSLAAAGCGGTKKSEPCGVDPCGGDVVGTWTAVSSCIDHDTLAASITSMLRGACPSVMLGDVTMTPIGTLTMNADMTFTGALDVNTAFDMNIPPSCSGGASCAMVEATLQSSVGRNWVTGVSCVGTGACICTWTQTLDVINATGTFGNTGTTLTFPEAPGGDGPYCVQGSTLHLVGYDTATKTKIISDLVMEKH